jgi:hypothetical protein
LLHGEVKDGYTRLFFVAASKMNDLIRGIDPDIQLVWDIDEVHDPSIPVGQMVRQATGFDIREMLAVIRTAHGVIMCSVCKSDLLVAPDAFVMKVEKQPVSDTDELPVPNHLPENVRMRIASMLGPGNLQAMRASGLAQPISFLSFICVI